MRLVFILVGLLASLGARGIGFLLALIAALTYDPYMESTRFFRPLDQAAKERASAEQQTPPVSRPGSQTSPTPPSETPQRRSQTPVDGLDTAFAEIARSRILQGAPAIAPAPADPLEPSALRRDPVNSFVDPMIGMRQAMAQNPLCRLNVLGAVPPDLTTQRAPGSQIFCDQAFAVQTNPATRLPLWTAHRLTPQRVAMARNTLRSSEFYDEQRVPAATVGRLTDYRRSGYDRGHMVPSGDMASPDEQSQTFSMVNIVPQDPTNNRCFWSDVEMAVRMYVNDSGREVFVITAPLARGLQPMTIGSGVTVPSHLMKAVYEPSTKRSIVFFVENTPNPRWTFGTSDQIYRSLGLRLFPAHGETTQLLPIDPMKLRSRDGCPRPLSPQ
jgi:endonuclease G